MAKTKRTWQPSKTRRIRKFGWRQRVQTVGGRNVIKNRIKKQRKKLTASTEFGSKVVKNKLFKRRRR